MRLIKKWRTPFVSLIMVSFITACSSFHHHEELNGDNDTLAPFAMIYSPNGEPLNGGSFGRPTCEQAMMRWFDRVDRNHDGVVTRDEFLVDATNQFRTMDIDKNGYLVPEELERYRRPFRQQPDITATDRKASEDDERPDPDHKHPLGMGSGEGASKTDLNDQEDPVMSADTNNDFRVTLDEFLADAKLKFDLLDKSHTGALKSDAILERCDLSKM